MAQGVYYLLRVRKGEDGNPHLEHLHLTRNPEWWPEAEVLGEVTPEEVIVVTEEGS